MAMRFSLLLSVLFSLVSFFLVSKKIFRQETPRERRLGPISCQHPEAFNGFPGFISCQDSFPETSVRQNAARRRLTSASFLQTEKPPWAALSLSLNALTGMKVKAHGCE